MTEQDAGVLHAHLHWLVEALEWSAALIDILSIGLMLIGATRFVLGFVRAELARVEAVRVQGINHERQELGRYILAGLELLIVSDIIHTALSLKLEDLLFLGLLVVIRSAISFFLDREIRELRMEATEVKE
ncbi:DUF1622 domain-containing protein [Roseobacter sp. HKCCA0434]|uniref:DUF1622 domain-containing protein n=1 Tax=Roseobacter sp. HKCCA0434 TaxID=3079297 RepID=UPI0029058E43|nr:DUF1622 domain-containing protein [Roseobacter sp. HKCCA0434]